ncbi:hypothetical protein F2P81_003197 [Scophthalmus maximus]|uniref:Uncharacterized protein n=1 Tax=Scophthalmus maximus TaxID=52904 RepID=A0A6A4TGT5_SCOMX|nr:hypothetical protein F2P81_003197 [Scophthalmus maximus]
MKSQSDRIVPNYITHKLYRPRCAAPNHHQLVTGNETGGIERRSFYCVFSFYVTLLFQRHKVMFPHPATEEHARTHTHENQSEETPQQHRRRAPCDLHDDQQLGRTLPGNSPTVQYYQMSFYPASFLNKTFLCIFRQLKFFFQRLHLFHNAMTMQLLFKTKIEKILLCNWLLLLLWSDSEVSRSHN